MNRADFTFDEYQANVLRTANQKLDWSQTVENCLLGLIGELGEILQDLNPINQPMFESLINYGGLAELIKKYKFHGKIVKLEDYPADMSMRLSLKRALNDEVFFVVKETANLSKELGDVMYYLVWLIDTLGYDASEVAQANVEKLRKRYADGFSIEASLNRKD